MLNDKRIDAVFLDTLDHWHPKIMFDAVGASKHVYVEQPIGNTLEEFQIMLAAAEKQKVIQVGQWQRGGLHYAKRLIYYGWENLEQFDWTKIGISRMDETYPCFARSSLFPQEWIILLVWALHQKGLLILTA